MKIGRHEIVLNEVASITARGRLRSLFLGPGYDVHLKSGARLHFTPEEKQQFDEQCEQEILVRQIYDVARGAGLRAFA